MDTKDIKNIKNVSDIQRVMNTNQVVWQGGTPLKDLPIGSKVVDPNTKYYGQPIVWIIADKNHEGYPANTVTLISEKLLCFKCLDAKEPSNINSLVRSRGNNDYRYSNLLQWLNSDAINWYSPQHEADEPPSANYSESNKNCYDTESGFLYNFSSDFKKAIILTNLKTVKSSMNGSETVTSQIFLASTTEVGLANENGIVEGTRFPIFNDNLSRKAYPTAEAINVDEYKYTKMGTSNAWYYWLRTPVFSSSYSTRYISSDGSLNYTNAVSGSTGVRPLCNVKDNSAFFEVIK